MKTYPYADLKQTLLYFAREMFGKKVEIRLRPSYFLLQNPRLKWILVARSAEERDAMYVNIQGGWKY